MKQASASSTDHGGGKRRGGTRRAAWIAHGLLLPLSVFGKFAGPIGTQKKIGTQRVDRVVARKPLPTGVVRGDPWLRAPHVIARVTRRGKTDDEILRIGEYGQIGNPPARVVPRPSHQFGD